MEANHWQAANATGIVPSCTAGLGTVEHPLHQLIQTVIALIAAGVALQNANIPHAEMAVQKMEA